MSQVNFKPEIHSVATPRTVREINIRRTIQLLMQVGKISRAGLARELDMMRSTAGSLIEELVTEVMLRPVQSARSPATREKTAGRPGEYFELNPDYARFIGVEAGVRHIRLIARDFQGRICHSDTIMQQGQSLEPLAVTARLIDTIHNATAILGWPEDNRLSLGLSFPGMVSKDGEVVRAPMLCWRGVSLVDDIRAAFPHLRDLYCDNDANALAVAELAEGAIRDVRYGICVWLDTGVGGAIVNSGRVIRGQNGHAGEFGHILTMTQNPRSQPPQQAEELIGRQSIFDDANTILGHNATVQDILNALEVRHPEVLRIVEDWQIRCAALIASLTSVLDTGTVVLGGPLAQLFRNDLAFTADNVAKFLVPGHVPPTLTIAQTGLTAAALGMAINLHNRLLQIPA